MTSTKKCSVKSNGKSFFGFVFRHNWQQMVLYCVILLLCVGVPTMIRFNQFDPAYKTADMVSNEINDIFEMMMLTGIVVSAGIGAIAGLSALSYVNNKTKTGSWHSFPVTREEIYFTESLVHVVYYLIAAVIAYGLTLTTSVLTLASMNCLSYFGENACLIVTFCIAAVLCFLLALSLFLFTAGLTGTGFMRFVMAGLVLLLPIALYAMIVEMFRRGIPNLYESYYLSERASEILCLPVRVVDDIAADYEGGKWGLCTLVRLLPEAVIFYVGGLLLHKFRKSERAGTPIIWKPVNAVTRYALIVAASLFFGYLFDAIFGDAVSLFCGLTFGAILAWMLVNCILNRSLKSMFAGWRGFLVCLACIELFTLIVPFNLFGFVGKPYSEAATKSLILEYDGREIPIESEETKKVLLDAMNRASGHKGSEMPVDSMRDYDVVMEDGVYYDVPYEPETVGIAPWADISELDFIRELYPEAWYDEKYESDDGKIWIYDYESFVHSTGYHVNVIQKPYFGIPLALNCLMATDDGEARDAIFRSPEFIEAHNLPEILKDKKINNFDISIFNYGTHSYGFDEEHAAAANELFRDFISGYRYDPSHMDRSAIAGYISVYADGSYNCPVYADQVELINEMLRTIEKVESDRINVEPVELYPTFASEEEVYDAAFAEYKYFALINLETGEIRHLDTETAQRLFRETADIGLYYGIKEFTKCGDQHYTLICRDGEYYNTRNFNFRDGAIGNVELDAIFDSMK